MTVKEAKEIKKMANKIAVLTGAGISTESNLPDFRSQNGIYKTLTTALTFNIRLFRIWPRQFYKVIGPFYQDCVNARPNAGHEALAELERQGKCVEIVTQNVDCLHQKAGSSIVHEIHGTIGTVTCIWFGVDAILIKRTNDVVETPRPYTEQSDIERQGRGQRFVDAIDRTKIRQPALRRDTCSCQHGNLLGVFDVFFDF